MKIIHLLLSLSLILLISSCNSDKNNNSDDIQGTWNITAFNSQTMTTTTYENPPVEIVSNVDLVALDLDATLTFTDTKHIVVGTMDIQTTTTISGITSDPIVTLDQEVAEEATYKLDGNTLIYINSDGLETNFNIVEQSANVLVLQGSRTQFDDIFIATSESIVDVYYKLER